MKIRLKLFAALRDYLPAGATSNEIEFEVADGISLKGMTDLNAVPAKRVHLVLVNGYHVPPSAYSGTILKEGDIVAMWPPVAGG
jgi:molybdopterin synthase sulfur carrier subunit